MGLGSAEELGHGYTNMSDSELSCHRLDNVMDATL